MMTTKIVTLGLCVVVVLAGGAFWYMQNARVEAAYLDALSDCKAGLGAGRLAAADALFGKDSRPRKLAMPLSLCDLEQSVEDYKKAADALN